MEERGRKVDWMSKDRTKTDVNQGRQVPSSNAQLPAINYRHYPTSEPMAL
jgi:hypothetical protein